MGEKMKKIKDLWMNNRVLFVLCIVVIVCFIIIGVVCANLFFGNSSSVYGDRLEGLSEYPVTEEEKEAIITSIKENEGIKEVEVRTQGKIIYIRIELQDVTIDRAKEIAVASLGEINEEKKAMYDIHYTLVSDETSTSGEFIIMGAKNINRSQIIWNNNNPMPPQTEGDAQ